MVQLSDFLTEIHPLEQKKIGEILIETTSLTEDQLNEAIKYQQSHGGLLGEILVEKEYIQSHEIVKVVCKQLDLDYVEQIDVNEIDPNLTIDIPINYAKSNYILPFLETSDEIWVLIADPFNENVLNDLKEIFRKEIRITVTAPTPLVDAINRVYEKANRNLVDSLEDEFDESMDLDGPIDILDAGEDEAPVKRFVSSIIFRAVKEKASDIHIEPYERDVVYRFRINGVMQEILRQPLKTQAAVSSRIKVMAKLDIAEKRLPQDGRIKIKMAGKDIDIRLSTVPVQNGERIVMRVLEKTDKILALETLGFEGVVLKHMDELSRRKHGVLYVTGPTGSGKTTTLSAILDRINDPDKMIITVEDPVEYEIPGISQIQVNSKIDLSFARSLRAIVRQDPDVIMVGETRDVETATMAIEASLTGHFVLSTLHTNDAPSAPNRLIDMGVQPFLIASSLVGVLAQRLIQTLCPECKEEHTITKSEMKALGLTEIPENATFYSPKGCPDCNYRGYSGRTTISELMLISDEIRSLVMEKADASRLKKVAVAEGMTTLKDSAMSKVFRGITSIEEIIRVVNSEEMTE
ncbi:MAG: type II secretion system ATPase GspE [Bacteriovoracaceae bacterium]